MADPATCPPSLLPANRPRRALIGLTPLIDVVFILLVFFMLASNFLDWRSIDLGTSAKAGAGTSMEGSLVIDIRADGLRIGGDPVALAELPGKIESRLRHRSDLRVLVRPAQGIVLQKAVSVLDILAHTGVKDISVIRHAPQ